MATTESRMSMIKGPLMLALAVIVVRIVLERFGAPAAVTMVFGVVWLHMLLPIWFAKKAVDAGSEKPFIEMLKITALFTIPVRLAVAVTYALAFAFSWDATRFSVAGGGSVGGDESALWGYVLTPLGGAVFNFVFALILAAIIGGLTLVVLRRRQTSPA